MNPVLILLSMMGILVVESTILQVEPFSFVAPNVVLVMVMFVSLMRGPMLAMYIGLIIGLVQDVLFGTYLGLHAFTYATIGYFTGSTFRVYWARQLVMVILVMLAYTFLSEFIMYGVGRLFGTTHETMMAVVKDAVRMMIWNGVFALLLYSPSVRLLAKERRGMSDEAL